MVYQLRATANIFPVFPEPFWFSLSRFKQTILWSLKFGVPNQSVVCMRKMILNLNSLWPSHMMFEILINTGTVKGLLSDSTMPLPEPVLTYHQQDPLAFILNQFCWITINENTRYSSIHSFQDNFPWILNISIWYPKLCLKCTFEITTTPLRGQWVNVIMTKFICVMHLVFS